MYLFANNYLLGHIFIRTYIYIISNNVWGSSGSDKYGSMSRGLTRQCEDDLSSDQPRLPKFEVARFVQSHKAFGIFVPMTTGDEAHYF